MPVARLAATVAALLAVLALVAGTAAAAPEATAAGPSVTYRIFADYAQDGVIDGDWSTGDLNRALKVAKANGTAFGEFASAVDAKYDREIGGFAPDSGGGTPADLSLLPVPTAPGERDQPPWPFLALTALGAALVLTGAGSSIYRRARRSA